MHDDPHQSLRFAVATDGQGAKTLTVFGTDAEGRPSVAAIELTAGEARFLAEILNRASRST